MVRAVSGDKPKSGEKLVVVNRRATFDYAIEERYEAGIVLLGSEVKSFRAGKVDVSDAYATEENGEVWLKQLYVAPFEAAKAFPHEVRRSRKLLLHKREIEALKVATQRGGYTVVPLRIYFKDGSAKIELGVGKGKKHYDKRADIAKKTAEREARDSVARGRKGD
ncbi:SsrA-binding protein [soil metagenome]